MFVELDFSEKDISFFLSITTGFAGKIFIPYSRLLKKIEMSYYFLCTVPKVIYISKEKHETNLVTCFKPHLGVTGLILFTDAFHGSALQNGSI